MIATEWVENIMMMMMRMRNPGYKRSTWQVGWIEGVSSSGLVTMCTFAQRKIICLNTDFMYE